MNGWGPIWAHAEELRSRFLVGRLAHLPVDVFTLAEVELKLDVVPFDDLFEKYSADAALMVDLSGIYVDAEAYDIWERGPIWKQRRLRFSVAHELGHFLMHREVLSERRFGSVEEFAAWTKTNRGNRYTYEQEANEFAGRLLVPVDALRLEYERFVEAVQTVVPKWESAEGLRRNFAERICSRFEVSAQVVEARLDREEIWPSR